MSSVKQSDKTDNNKSKTRLSVIRIESVPDGKLEQYEKDDLNKNQQIDWEDVYQRHCRKHERSYHIKCLECYP